MFWRFKGTLCSCEEEIGWFIASTNKINKLFILVNNNKLNNLQEQHSFRLFHLYAADPATILASNGVLDLIFLWDQLVYSFMEKNKHIWVCTITSSVL